MGLIYLIYCNNLFVIIILLLSETDDTVLTHINKEARTDAMLVTCFIHRARNVVAFYINNTAEVLQFKEGRLLILINYILIM